MEMNDFYWPPAQAVLENACRNRLPTACIVCLCTSVKSSLKALSHGQISICEVLAYILAGPLTPC